MLFKVATRQSFTCEEDRIGVIEAQSLKEAVEKLKKWAETSLWGSDLEQLSGADIEMANDWATVKYHLRWVPDDEDALIETGYEEYIIKVFVPSSYPDPDPGILMFLAEDWRQIFSTDKVADHSE